jgi:Flp pilus assembly protein TadG
MSKRKRISNQPKSKGQRGQSLVEMALSLVFLIFLVAGIIDTGRAILTLITMRDAVQEGVVYGSLNPDQNGLLTSASDPCTTCGIDRRVRSASGMGSSNFLLDFTNTVVTITYPTGGPRMVATANPPNTIKVAMTYTFRFTMPFFSGTTLPLKVNAIAVILKP